MSGPVDVLAVLDALLAFASRGVERDDPARELIEDGHAARATVAELIETNQRVTHHLASAVEFIEKQYPNARQLDRGPIMRNMRRWRDQLSVALANVGGAK